ncbi:MAG: hypothetical protein J6K25_15980 [Thermoguttaceae bacterium]|nr:hypothetical protein [Thermoguttaceae bacterium]MBP3532654.1 hypothetical protein [Thermoguttaceae bacterium]
MRFTAKVGAVKKALKQVWDGAAKSPATRAFTPSFELEVLNFRTARVRGRDYGDRTVEIVLDLEDGEPGDKVAVDAGLLNAVKVLDDASDVNFDFLDSKVEITSENGKVFRFAYGYIDVPDSPRLPRLKQWGDADAVFNVKEFVRCLTQTGFAVDVDNAHYALGGVLLNIVGERGWFVATCGRRLACRSEICGRGGEGKDKTAIIPAATVAALTKIVPVDSDFIGVVFGEGKVLFEWDSGRLETVLIDGRFPNWQSILDVCAKEVEAQYEAADARKAADAFAKIGCTEVTVRTGKDELIFENEEKGAKIVIPAAINGIESASASLDVKFYVDFLMRADGRVTHYVNDSHPNLMTDENGWDYVLMPLKK